MAVDPNFPDHLTDITPAFTVPDDILNEFTVHEIVLVESLKTPGLMTSIKGHSFLHTVPNKNLDGWKNAMADLTFERPILAKFGFQSSMNVFQRIYRLGNRKLINNQNEEYVLFACDDTLLNDARSLVSQSWKCTRPSEVVRQVLQSCAGAQNIDIEDADPARDYIAENIHPFQVVAQQADAALAQGNDPSFVHYMTYENGGTHHFRSLKSLVQQTPIIELTYTEAGWNPGTPEGQDDIGRGGGYRNPHSIMQYSFPCDFDLLSDILNGVDANGKDISSLTVVNPLSKEVSVLGNPAIGCGIGGAVYKQALTNINTSQQQDSCNIDVENHLLKRQARMNLLEQDKVAIRLTVPWNPIYHAGKVITVKLYNKNDTGKLLYGSGNYLISTMVHTIKRGGFSTTTMDCTSITVGNGIV